MTESVVVQSVVVVGVVTDDLLFAQLVFPDHKLVLFLALSISGTDVDGFVTSL